MPASSRKAAIFIETHPASAAIRGENPAAMRTTGAAWRDLPGGLRYVPHDTRRLTGIRAQAERHDMTRAYAIGDIHGHLDLLVEAHARIKADRARTGDAAAPVIHLGDLVDRGPESAEVLEYLISGTMNGKPWVTLKGNHDNMFEVFLKDPEGHDPGLRADLTWLDPRLGGETTLKSYGIEVDDDGDLTEIWKAARDKVPDSHRAFLDSMPLMHRLPGLVFVHAGIRPGVPLDEQDPTDLMWIRKEFHIDDRDHGALVVHGHTPVDAPMHYGNRLNLDTGAAYGGPLTAAVFEDGQVFELSPEGRAPIRP